MSVLEPGELEASPLADLHAIASELGLEGYRRLRREDLIHAIVEAQGGDTGALAARRAPEPRDAPESRDGDEGDEGGGAGDVATGSRGGRSRGERPERGRRGRDGRGGRPAREPEDDEPTGDEEVRSGVLDILPNGSGFMRPEAFAHSAEDVYVSPAQIRRCELRSGDQIEGPIRPPRRSERHPSLIRVDKVNGADAEPPEERPSFDALTPVYASERLSAPPELASLPFGKGSRVAIGGPPGAGATTLLRGIVSALRESHPDLGLTVVLAGVRPEEVTDWRREDGVEVAGGGFDRSADEQAAIAEMAVERAKRAVERGGHAAVVIDSLDVLSPGAARRVFGAARRTEEGGSLTLIAATGMAAEPQRQATTRVVLEPWPAGAKGPSVSAASSGTVRPELFG